MMNNPEHGQTRRMLNKNSKATGLNWLWEDFSEVITRLSEHYAETLPLGLPDQLKDTRLTIPERVALEEMGVNGELINSNCFVFRLDLWQEITTNNTFVLNKPIASLVPLAELESRTGFHCQPRIIWGLADFVYPIILPIIKRRVRTELLSEMEC